MGALVLFVFPGEAGAQRRVASLETGVRNHRAYVGFSECQPDKS